MRKLKQEDVVTSRDRSKKKEFGLKKEIVAKLNLDGVLLKTMRSRSKLVLNARMDNLISINKERYKTNREIEGWARRGY